MIRSRVETEAEFRLDSPGFGSRPEQLPLHPVLDPTLSAAGHR
jgi:hypothetical protein